MKKIIALILVLALCLPLIACGSSNAEEPTEEKKQLPVATNPTEDDVPEETLYKDAMIPFEDLIPAERIVILQNAVNFGREGFYTEETKPITEEVVLDGQTVAAYKLTYALQFLTFGYENGAQVVNEAGDVLEMTKEELDACSTCDMNCVVNNGLSEESMEQLKTKTGEELVDEDMKRQGI